MLTLRMMLIAEKKSTKLLTVLKFFQEALFLLGDEDQTELMVIHHKTSRTMSMTFKNNNYRVSE